MDEYGALKGLAETMFKQVIVGSEGKKASDIQADLDDQFDQLLMDAMCMKKHQRIMFKASIKTIREAYRKIAGP